MNIRHPDGLGDAVHPLPPLQGEKRGPGRRAVSPGTCQHLLQVEDGFQRPVSTTALKRLPFPGRAPSRPKQEQPWGQSNRSKMRPAGWADARRPLVPRVAKVGWVTVLSRTSVSSEPTTSSAQLELVFRTQPGQAGRRKPRASNHVGGGELTPTNCNAGSEHEKQMLLGLTVFPSNNKTT